MTGREAIYCIIGSLGFLLAAIATFTHMDWRAREYLRRRRARRRGGMVT